MKYAIETADDQKLGLLEKLRPLQKAFEENPLPPEEKILISTDFVRLQVLIAFLSKDDKDKKRLEEMFALVREMEEFAWFYRHGNQCTQPRIWCDEVLPQDCGSMDFGYCSGLDPSRFPNNRCKLELDVNDLFDQIEASLL